MRSSTTGSSTTGFSTLSAFRALFALDVALRGLDDDGKSTVNFPRRTDAARDDGAIARRSRRAADDAAADESRAAIRARDRDAACMSRRPRRTFVNERKLVGFILIARVQASMRCRARRIECRREVTSGKPYSRLLSGESAAAALGGETVGATDGGGENRLVNDKA